jgi:mannose/cellobiose epimerase-like protein (N-acyl-D-glucosamine 2-epimerase family)
MAEPLATNSSEKLLAAVRHGADYLTRIVGSSGRYVYMYHPVDDRGDGSYGWLRHCGTTYALFEAYEEFGTPSYLDTGERALRYLTTHLAQDSASHGKYIIDTDDEEQQKVGGAALALLAFSKHAAVTGKTDDPEALETMRALARFIIKQQYADGHFRSNADVEREVGKKLKREPVYYPGEAVLALVRFYAIDAQPTYLDAARKAADWIVHVRDAFVSEDNQEHDHWITYALNELYRVTRDDAYLKHAFKIARAIQLKQRPLSAATPLDLVGTFYDGQTTPASTRVEAYDADIVLSRFAGKPEAWLMAPAQEAARSILWQQYGPDNDYWLKNPAKADGGVRESPFVHDVRIDYVQHAMSAWLHLARILRDPDYGKTGVPSQDLVRTIPPGRSALH